MTRGDRSLSEWEIKLEVELSVHDKSIERWLIQWGIQSHYQKNEIKNAVFIHFKERVESGEIKIQGSNETLQFFTVNSQQEQPIRELRAYLRTCLFNEVLRILRKERSRSRYQVNIEDAENLVSRTSQDDLFSRNNPENWLTLCEIREKMSQLSREDRRILELSCFECLPFIEIAKQLEIEGFPLWNPEALRQRKKRALDRLRLKYK